MFSRGTTETAGEPRPLRPAERWLLFAVRVAIIALVACAVKIQLPVLDNWLPVKDVTVVAAAIVLTGKALFDTLFYDHYWP
jgi:hypothetical protein